MKRLPSLNDLRDLAEQSARDWKLSVRAIWALALLPIFVVLCGAVAALRGKEVYKRLIEDDSVAENLQVLFFALAAVFALQLSRKLLHNSERLLSSLYLLVAVGLAFLVGEEISWGQRIFDWSTPEALGEINRQGETNVHNVYGVRMAFKFAQLVIGAYGTFLPILVPRWSALSAYRPMLSWLVPHVALLGYFAPLFVFRVYRTLFDPPASLYFAISEFNELLELNLALGFFFFMAYQLRRTGGGAAEVDPTLARSTMSGPRAHSA